MSKSVTTNGKMIYLPGVGAETIQEATAPENLENSISGNGEILSQNSETEMIAIRRPYTINGCKVWIEGKNEQDIAEKFAGLKVLEDNKSQGRQKTNFREYVSKNWRFIEQTIQPQTAKDYRTYLNKDILPFFGSMSIEDIEWRDIQDFYDLFSSKARQTVHKRKVVLSRIMQLAHGDRLIEVDPTKNKKLVHSKKTNERLVPDKEKYLQFLAAITNLSQPHYQLYMALIAYTGMRKGEALGLQWEHISFNDNCIHIKRAARLDKSTDGKVVIKPPKTKAGVRTVPLQEPLRNLLLLHKRESGYIVTDNRTGKPIHSDGTFNTMMRYIKKEMDLGNFTSHSFRHAFATLCISSGVDIKTTQTVLGHSQASTTMNIYAHAVPSNIQQIASIFNKVEQAG